MDPYSLGRLQQTAEVAKDNLHIMESNNAMDHSLTHAGLNNIGIMLDTQNERADAYFEKLQSDHITVFDKLQGDHTKVFEKLQKDHTEVFTKLQENSAIVFAKLQEDHSTMLGKFQKDHYQLITQVYNYQVQNALDLLSIRTMLNELLSAEQKASSDVEYQANLPSDEEPRMETVPPNTTSSAPIATVEASILPKNEFTGVPTSAPTGESGFFELAQPVLVYF